MLKLLSFCDGVWMQIKECKHGSLFTQGSKHPDTGLSIEIWKWQEKASRETNEKQKKVIDRILSTTLPQPIYF